MSRLQLKKELAAMDTMQLRELILEIYDARKEAKEYLGFYLNPDIRKLTDKYKAAVEKEATRVSRRRVSPRMSRIKKSIKEYASFGMGKEYEIEMMLYALGLLIPLGGKYWLKETLSTSIERFMTETLKAADIAGMADVAFPRIGSLIRQLPSPVSERDSFKSDLILAYSNYTPSTESQMQTFSKKQP